MKRIACLYFLCVFTNAAYAQSIKGCIVDSVKTPVPFATIAVISSKDSSIIRGSISDENGNFLVKPISRGS
ncbi:MAG TPA: carboxypeptidase-like regulatory domain-containing protein, partial [Bacteroidia bacterium]|nr:carboxypeptidase-like regulatory domain-containing protein [Bacteroidia bacterium]